jgi:hypothetical protein
MWMLPEYQVIRMNQAAKRRAKAEGRTIDDVLLDIIYAKSGGVMADVDIRDRLAAIRCWKEYTMRLPVDQAGNKAPVASGPIIRLPEAQADPAQVRVVK